MPQMPQKDKALHREGSQRIYLYRQVVDSLLSQIRQGEYKAGSQLPTENDLVAHFGVSRIVIRQAMGELEQMRIVTRTRGRGTFVRDLQGRNGAVARAGVAVICGYTLGMQDPLAFPMLNHLQWAMEHEYDLRYVGYDEQSCSDFNAISHNRDLAGIILLLPDKPIRTQEILDRLDSIDVPKVLLNCSSEIASIPSVLCDNYTGGRLAAEHTFELGHKRVMAIQLKDRFISWSDRIEGFIDTLNILSKGSVKCSILESDHVCIYSDMCRVIEGSEVMPELIFAGDDQIAHKIITALSRYGIRVPGDVSVLGFNDNEQRDSHVPPLTTVHMPLKEMSMQAFRLLHNMRQNKRPRRGDRYLILPRLIVRNSTGTPRKHLLTYNTSDTKVIRN